jgi:hypothetical protein
MPDTLTFIEVDGHHAEMLPARTVLSLATGGSFVSARKGGHVTVFDFSAIAMLMQSKEGVGGS